MGNYAKVVDILTTAQKDISQALNGPEDQLHKLRLTQNLDRDIKHISLLHGVEDTTEAPPADMGPAKTIGGRPIKLQPKLMNESLAPSETAVATLKGKVEAAWVEFQTLPAKEILNKWEDLVIRGVAKKAKMKVTKDDPERLTIPFINRIKHEIKVVEAMEARTAESA